MTSTDRESLEDFERESPDEIEEMIEQEPIIDTVSNDESTEVISTAAAKSSTEISVPAEYAAPVLATLIESDAFHQAPVETVIQKHGQELASSLMDALRKTKAGIMKKDQAESVCNIARELTSLAKEEINLLRTLRK